MDILSIWNHRGRYTLHRYFFLRLYSHQGTLLDIINYERKKYLYKQDKYLQYIKDIVLHILYKQGQNRQKGGVLQQDICCNKNYCKNIYELVCRLSKSLRQYRFYKLSYKEDIYFSLFFHKTHQDIYQHSNYLKVILDCYILCNYHYLLYNCDIYQYHIVGKPLKNQGNIPAHTR